MGGSWLSVPRDWLASFGEIAKFSGRVLGDVYSLRVLRFFGEALRQSGILIVSSTIVIWGLVFIIGLQCGIEGAYFNRSVGAPAYAGVFAAWCDLRELVPYAFGYMMAAKVGTGIVAELGSMRISEEIDALEVMGFDSMLFLCATRLLAAWIVLPFMYIAAVGAGFFASYLAVVVQIGEPGGAGLIKNVHIGGVHVHHWHAFRPISTPSRACLLTGQYGFRNGVTFFRQPIRPDAPRVAREPPIDDSSRDFAGAVRWAHRSSAGQGARPHRALTRCSVARNAIV